MNMIRKEELINLLIEKYGDIDNSGCYTGDNREWLSTQEIVFLINSCTEYKENLK